MLSVRMRLSSVLLLAVLVVSSVVEGRSESEPESLNQVVEEPPFTACIDDGDCNKGEGFACFQYICYPWRDDTVIERKHRQEIAHVMMEDFVIMPLPLKAFALMPLPDAFAVVMEDLMFIYTTRSF